VSQNDNEYDVISRLYVTIRVNSLSFYVMLVECSENHFFGELLSVSFHFYKNQNQNCTRISSSSGFPVNSKKIFYGTFFM